MFMYNIRTPYNGQATATLGATTTQLGTLVAAALRGFFITELDFEGMGAGTSSNNELGVFRIGTAGVTGSNALQIRPVNPASPAAAMTAFFTYATQPIIVASTDPVQNCPFNGNGQRYNWKALPNYSDAIWVPPGNNAAASVGLFPMQGTAAFVGRVKVCEV
jgi:hypothetical protein